MQKATQNLLSLLLALCCVGAVCGQEKELSVDEVGLKLSGAENLIQQSAFRAKVNAIQKTDDVRSRSYNLETLLIEADGKGNVRWKKSYGGVETETLLADGYIYERINGGPWKDVSDDMESQPSQLVWIRWRNFEEDTTFDYVVRLFPLFFERLKHVTVSRKDDIDGHAVAVFELSDLAAKDAAESKYNMEFWFRNDGRLQRIHTLIDVRAFGVESSDHYETDIDLTYDVSVEKIEAPIN